MAYKTSATTCRVQLIPYRDLDPAVAVQCAALRREAGRCWSAIVAAHVASRDGKWLREAELKAATKGGRYALHSQSVQALCEKLSANVATAHALRQQEHERGEEPSTRYPHHPRSYQTVTWKPSAIRVREGALHLSNGKGQSPLILPLPERYHRASIVQVELLWRADHYQLALTVEHAPHPPLRQDGQVAGVDLGEINTAAVCTEDGAALVINGRLLRHHKQLRNKRHAAYQERLSRCKQGSRHHKRLKRQQARASAKLYRQQRNHLHQSARKVVTFASAHDVKLLAIGDVRDVACGVKKGRHANQKIAQWPHGQHRRYLEEKARRAGIATALTREDYSTRTLSCCGHVLASAPRGRHLTCPGCGTRLHRDANGAANICSREARGSYGHVQVHTTMHQRATVVRAADPGPGCWHQPSPLPSGEGTPPEASHFSGR
jgi:putative transposase